jgi:hypothetical protein
MPKYLERSDKKHGINVDGTRPGTSTHTNRLLIGVYGTGPRPRTRNEGGAKGHLLLKLPCSEDITECINRHKFL